MQLVSTPWDFPVEEGPRRWNPPESSPASSSSGPGECNRNGQSYCRLWRATANGLEGLAALHNDGLLILDELTQIDPTEAGEAAYLLANGQGKNRASRNGSARQAPRWRLLFMSAGEESLSALMAHAKRKPTAAKRFGWPRSMRTRAQHWHFRGPSRI